MTYRHIDGIDIRIGAKPTRMEADRIAENRDRWIDEWIAVMEG